MTDRTDAPEHRMTAASPTPSGDTVTESLAHRAGSTGQDLAALEMAAAVGDWLLEELVHRVSHMTRGWSG